MAGRSEGVARDAYAVMLAAFRGPCVPAWLPGAYRRGLGGICLYGDNAHPVLGLAPLARAVAALDPTAVLATDEEGGDVTRLHMTTGSPAPGNAALGAVDDVGATRAVAAGIGAELRDAGVWLDLGPCADVDSNPANPVIGTRSFGSDAEVVARHVTAFIGGLADAGVAASVKHFPGHGDTATDSHLTLPRVGASRALLDARELVPFRAAIAAGVATVMTSHIVVEAVDPARPATLSRAVLTGLLREELGYDGVVVTDALDMAGASAELGIGGAAVAALAAGADLLCLGPEPTDGPRQLTQAVLAVTAAVGDNLLPRARLADAAARVSRLRATWAPSRPARPDLFDAGAAASRAVARAVVEGLDLPSYAGPVTVVRIDTGTNPAVGASAWGHLDLPGRQVDLVPSDLADLPPYAGPVLVVARRATADPQVWAWIVAQLDGNPDARLVELGRPDPQYADRKDVICTMGSSPALTGALTEALTARAGVR